MIKWLIVVRVPRTFILWAAELPLSVVILPVINLWQAEHDIIGGHFLLDCGTAGSQCHNLLLSFLHSFHEQLKLTISFDIFHACRVDWHAFCVRIAFQGSIII